MLLNELIGVKKYQHLTLNQIYEELHRRYGIQIIDGGQYGTILSKGDWDYVIKVVEDDPYYLNFVNYVINNRNEHYPRMRRKPLNMHSFYLRSSERQEKFWLVFIEKLQPIQDVQLKRFLVYNLEPLTTAVYNLDNRGQEGLDTVNALNSNYSWILPDGSQEKGITAIDIFERYPWTKTLARAYLGVIDNVEGTPDIKGNNFMLRGNTIVIIDPVWEGETPYQAYDKAMASERDEESPEPAYSGPSWKIAKDKEQYQKKQKADRDAGVDINDDTPF